MQVVSPEFVKGKKVLLRLDIDVPLERIQDTGYRVQDDFRLKAGMPTLKLCLENAQKVIVIGHIGRPGGKEVPELSVKPVSNWLAEQHKQGNLPKGDLDVLENLRFESGEDGGDLEYAKELAKMRDVFVYEAFASHRPAASTTVLPTLLPHAAGLRFTREVSVLTRARENPRKPLVAIVGGAKVEDKFGSVLALAEFCDAVLVGGLLPKEIKEKNLEVPRNVMLGTLGENGIDLAEESVEAFIRLIKNAGEIIWGGPIGKYEDPEGIKGTGKLAEAILFSQAETIVGGGDIVAAITKLGLLEKFEDKGLVSVGGGAMLKLLSEGTLPTMEALS
ncbi:phosphoglycerate kinase [Candidatus Daviesbacteria bacterium]|nr:phosphoglycerate kinase [Candidatus Daviesbacteria bacterium]